MIQRLYVHNYRCLENFELSLEGLSSALLIGKNGAGKSTVRAILELFQKIGRGVNRVGSLIQHKDFAGGRTGVPIRFELEALIGEERFEYTLAFELPERFRELRVLKEELVVGGETVLTRDMADVKLVLHEDMGTKFTVDWHLVALPVIHEGTERAPVNTFRTWLSRMLILAPVPSLMTGESTESTLEPERDGSNFSAWLSGLLSQFPASYTEIDKYLRTIMPDLHDIQLLGTERRYITVRFGKGEKQIKIDFDDLSDGEKCFFICALVLASNKHYGPLFCFWDEPDSHLSISEIGQLVTALRRTFKTGQFLATSHNLEAIRKFSASNTLLLYKNSHLEPTQLKLLDKIDLRGRDFVDALLLDDLEP